MKLLISALVAAALALAALGAFVYLGLFNVAADEPHSAAVFKIMETVRARSIATRVKGIEVPSLDDPKLIAAGAGHYSEMCSGCHLAPDRKESELRNGLYPRPPDLTKHLHPSAAETFWVIKHGIKMSGMPAWGTTHDDESIWGLVAFLQKLPHLTADQYRAMLTDEVPAPSHDEHKIHHHQK
jgi:mono/diheme cytochrome c family protein